MNNAVLAPVIIFCYKRPKHLKRTVEALQRNKLAKDSELYIFSDGFKNETDKEGVLKVRKYIKSIDGFKNITIVEREKNFGLAKSVIDGVTQIIRKFGKVIVLESDLISSPDFLNFMNDALIKYEKHKYIWSVTGYNFPININQGYKYEVYLSLRTGSWGWATWQDRWEKAEWNINKDNPFFNNNKQQRRFNAGGDDLTRMLIRQVSGEIDSWAVRWNFNQFLNKAYCLYPVRSKILNIGMDESGTHFKRKTKKFQTELSDLPVQFPDILEEDIKTIKIVNRFLRKPWYLKAVRWILLKTGTYKLIDSIIEFLLQK